MKIAALAILVIAIYIAGIRTGVAVYQALDDELPG